MQAFDDLAAVEEALAALAEREPPLVVRLPRQPGRKEQRYAHLFAGPPELTEEESSPQAQVRGRVSVEHERLAALEAEVAALRGELAELRAQLAAFRAQFE